MKRLNKLHTYSFNIIDVFNFSINLRLKLIKYILDEKVKLLVYDSFCRVIERIILVNEIKYLNWIRKEI